MKKVTTGVYYKMSNSPPAYFKPLICTNRRNNHWLGLMAFPITCSRTRCSERCEKECASIAKKYPGCNVCGYTMRGNWVKVSKLEGLINVGG